MRESLRRMHQIGKHDVFTGKVGIRVKNFYYKGDWIPQKVITDIRNVTGDIEIDHLQMAVGKEIPDDPDIYSQIYTGRTITFRGEAVPYKTMDGRKDYTLRMLELMKVE